LTLGIYLTLDQSIINYGDYSSGNKITGTIYSDIYKSVAFNLTDYTVTLRLYRENGTVDYLNGTCAIVTAASGTFSLTVTDGLLPQRGLYLAEVEVSKSGILLSSINRVELLIQ